MCELFAMSSRTPAMVRYSLSEFALHGGKKFANKDGWGIVFHQERDAYLFKEPSPAYKSPLEKMVVEYGRPSRYVLAHVRRASSGPPALENTHPFRRVQNGRVHNFAHNGDLKNYVQTQKGSAIDRACLGDTDSERAFVELLSRLSRLEGGSGEPAPLAERHTLFATFCAEMIGYGDANFLYCDGDALFVHAHRRIYAGEETPRAPGLQMLRGDQLSDGESWSTLGASVEGFDRQAVLFASIPVSDHDWEPLPDGCALSIKDGSERYRQLTR